RAQRLRTHYQYRTCQRQPDRDLRAFAAEEGEDLLADLDHVVARPWFISPGFGMLQRVGAKLLSGDTRCGQSAVWPGDYSRADAVRTKAEGRIVLQDFGRPTVIAS